MTLPEDVANQNSIRTLLRAITRSEGNFSLILACCNYTTLRRSIVQQLREQSPVEIRGVVLDQSVKTLYSTIAAKLGQEQPSAVMVFGLESVSALDQVLTATNQVREEFRKFAFPLMVWVTDEVWQKLIRLVPDFEGWATTVEFAIATDELIRFIQQTTDNVFAKVLETEGSIFLDNTAVHLGVGSPRRAELESARKELRDRGVNLDPELEASLEFVLGRDASGSSEQSRQHYERSLAYWQQSDNLLRRGCLLFYLGLWWRTYALGHRNEYERTCDQAKDYFQQSVEIFEQANRSDLAAKVINALGDSLQRLERWDELKVVTKKALALHLDHLDPFRLARAYGFLAEVALFQSNWTQARDFAKLAVALLENAQAAAAIPVSAEQIVYLDWERSFHQGWYLFSLAKSYSSLGQAQEAIKTLESARTATKSQYDPELYIGILNELRSLYFKQRDYLKAFQTKQERRAVEHQYGYRAFIGAGRLQSKQQVTNPTLPNIQIVPPEIPASGREQDVDHLVARLCRDDRRLTVIHGQSGVGKSSLLQAGLIPALKQTHKAIGTRDVLPVLQQVYTDWIRGLGESLVAALVETQYCSSLPGIAVPLLHATGATLKCSFANMPEPVTLDSSPAILELLQKNADNNLLTVLIFDQFEEFYFIHKDPAQRRQFYEFLRDCLNIPFVKVILSLREDYIFYLTECNNRLTSLDVVNNNILARENLYYIGNFSPEDARLVIQNFTKKAHFYLDADLIDQLVSELAAELGEVRPIELQVVGAQLQAENIRTLAQYHQSGPKAELVKRFLEEVIKDCGPENEQAARLILYLLTDESGTRPFKNRTELASSLSDIDESEKLGLVLEILVKSGLVFLLPEAEVPAERYQLVHDYLVSFIRQQNNLLTRLEKQRQELVKRKAEIDQLRKRTRLLGMGVATGIAAIAIAVLATQAEFQRRRAVNSEIQGHADSSEALFAVNKPLDALRESLIAGIQLKQATWGEAESSTKVKILTALQQTVYGIRERNRLEDHRGTVFSISFSPDGKMIASASADKTVKLWSVDGKLLRTLKGHSDSVFSVSFSPDGQTIASASKDGTVNLWNKNGSLLKTLKGHSTGVLSVSFSPDGQMIASASQDGVIKLWRRDGNEKLSWKGHRNRVSDIIFSPNGKTIASASVDGSIKLWGLDGTLLKTIEVADIYKISFSPDGKTIAAACLDGTVKLWNKNGSLQTTIKGFENIEDDNGVLSVTFSPDGYTIAATSKNGTVKLWNLKGELQMMLKGHQGWVHSVKFSPDGKTLASAGSDRTIRLWNLNGIGPKTLKGHNKRVSNISFSPNGQWVASASADETVKLWKRDGTLIHTLSGHQGGVWSVSFSPDARMLASAGEDKTVKLWRLDGTLLKTLEGHSDSVLSVKFSPNGQIIASASRDNTIKLWRRDGRLLKTLQGHEGLVNAISFSPDSQLLASASDDTTVKLWRIDGTVLKTLNKHKNAVLSVSFSPDGKTLASASADSTVKLWSLEGTLLKTFKHHTDWVDSISFSPNGQTLVSASRDKTVNIWSLDGTLLITLRGHEGTVNGVSFSPDGRTIASASDDRTVILWNLDDLELDNLLKRGCDRIHDYLKTNRSVEDSDRALCDKILTQK